VRPGSGLPLPAALSSSGMFPSLDLIRAGEDQHDVLANMLELYSHDFSEFLPLELRDDGRFGYKNLPLYWSDPRRRAFLARFENKLAGLVLVKKGSEISGSEISGDEEVWDMAEFFILRGYRRRGLGTELAAKVWQACPGKWEVRVMANNVAALRFWNSAVARFTGWPAQSVRLEIGGREWHVLSFEAKAS
jgi:predicted acetyltransferase